MKTPDRIGLKRLIAAVIVGAALSLSLTAAAVTAVASYIQVYGAATTYAVTNTLVATNALSSTGIMARTGSSTSGVVARTLTGTPNQISIANGDGSGTPTFSLAASVPYFVTTTVNSAGTSACYTWESITTGAGFTRTLPAASDGCTICFKKDNDADAITLARAGSDIIDGGTQFLMPAPNQQVCLRGRAGAWDVY